MKREKKNASCDFFVWDVIFGFHVDCWNFQGIYTSMLLSLVWKSRIKMPLRGISSSWNLIIQMPGNWFLPFYLQVQNIFFYSGSAESGTKTIDLSWSLNISLVVYAKKHKCNIYIGVWFYMQFICFLVEIL